MHPPRPQGHNGRTEAEKQLQEDVGFNLQGISQVRFTDTAYLEEDLAKIIRTYYGLGEEAIA